MRASNAGSQITLCASLECDSARWLGIGRRATWGLACGARSDAPAPRSFSDSAPPWLSSTSSSGSAAVSTSCNQGRADRAGTPRDIAWCWCPVLLSRARNALQKLIGISRRHTNVMPCKQAKPSRHSPAAGVMGRVYTAANCAGVSLGETRDPRPMIHPSSCRPKGAGKGVCKPPGRSRTRRAAGSTMAVLGTCSDGACASPGSSPVPHLHIRNKCGRDGTRKVGECLCVSIKEEGGEQVEEEQWQRCR